MADFNAHGNVEPAPTREDGSSISNGGSAHAREASDGAQPERDLAGALHEVSNALTVVLGWIERAQSDDDDIEGALEIAATRARQARNIVRRAIGAEAPAETRATVAEVVRDAVTGLEPEARRLGVPIRASVDPGVGGAQIDHSSTVLQILTNLLLNALAVSPSGACVRLDAGARGEGEVVLGVTDEGPGVEPARRATLFDAGVTTRPGGAGIGLRHAAALARRARGKLSLTKADGGACFELTWPRVGASGARRTISSPAMRSQQALTGVRVLLVEDDDAVVDLLDTALTARGATVVSTKSRAGLREALGSGSFDAALLDISPIVDDVVGALDAVRGASPAARVFVISGSASNMPALPDGTGAVWIRKPFEIRELVDALSKLRT